MSTLRVQSAWEKRDSPSRMQAWSNASRIGPGSIAEVTGLQ